jgi:hypothetical protein
VGDIVVDPPEIDLRPLQLAPHASHLTGMGIATGLHGGALGQTRVGLTQREAIPLGLPH